MVDTKEAAEVTVKIPADLHAALADLSGRMGASQEVLVREAIEQFVIERQRSWPRSIGMMSDPELSGADSEDWLIANWDPS